MHETLVGGDIGQLAMEAAAHPTPAGGGVALAHGRGSGGASEASQSRSEESGAQSGRQGRGDSKADSKAAKLLLPKLRWLNLAYTQVSLGGPKRPRPLPKYNIPDLFRLFF